MSSEPDLQGMFRELDRIEVPATALWEPSRSSSDRAWLSLRTIFGAGAAVTLAVAIVAFGSFVRGTGQGGTVTSSLSPSPSVASSSGATSATPSSTPPATSSPQLPRLETHALGKTAGDVAFAVLDS